MDACTPSFLLPLPSVSFLCFDMVVVTKRSARDPDGSGVGLRTHQVQVCLRRILGAAAARVHAQGHPPGTLKMRLSHDDHRILISRLLVLVSGISFFHQSLGICVRADVMCRSLLSFCQYWRNPTYNFMRIMLAIIIAFIYGSSFIGAGDLPRFIRSHSSRPLLWR